MSIEKLEQLYQSQFLNMYDALYHNKNNEERHWKIASRKTKEELESVYFTDKEDSTDAVLVAPLHKDLKALIAIKQFRMPLNDYIYELPAGLIDKGETIESTLERELKEETG